MLPNFHCSPLLLIFLFVPVSSRTPSVDISSVLLAPSLIRSLVPIAIPSEQLMLLNFHCSPLLLIFLFVPVSSRTPSVDISSVLLAPSPIRSLVPVAIPSEQLMLLNFHCSPLLLIFLFVPVSSRTPSVDISSVLLAPSLIRSLVP